MVCNNPFVHVYKRMSLWATWLSATHPQGSHPFAVLPHQIQMWKPHPWPLRWRHNDHAGVSNHQPHGCLLNRLFRRKSKKTSKLRVTGLCAGNSPGTGEFPAQMASYAENVSIWWRHHDRQDFDTPCQTGDHVIIWFLHPQICNPSILTPWFDYFWYTFVAVPRISRNALQWRHYGRDVVSIQPHDCLLNRLFGRRLKNASKVRVTGLCVWGGEIHRWPVNSPQKGPVTRKMLPIDDVTMAPFLIPQVRSLMSSSCVSWLLIKNIPRSTRNRSSCALILDILLWSK